MNIKNRGLKALLASVEAQAGAVITVKVLERVRAYIADAIRSGDLSLEHLDRHLCSLMSEGKQTLEKANKETLAARATLEVERIAGEYAAINPELVGQYIEEQNVVKVSGVGKDGNITGIIVESKDGLRGETLDEYIKRMRISPDTSFLFDDGDQADPSQKKGKGIVNPWRRETFNLTEQGRIVTANPGLAEKMRLEAEVGM
ncbi:MAG: hypothetical protein PHT96_03150 [Syntrophorhabdaceae bacterium]|nr:hypothetical protein [Syntrophorhabdaceae bacterium]